MSAVIELLDFVMRRLQVLPPEAPDSSASGTRTVKIEFVQLVKKDDHSKHTVALRIKSQPGIGKEGVLGPIIEAEIVGLIRCPEELPEERRAYMALYNGAVILYGLLRGQVAASTGAFPGGVVKLPSVDMKAMVDAWVAAQREEPAAKPEVPAKRKTRKAPRKA